MEGIESHEASVVCQHEHKQSTRTQYLGECEGRSSCCSGPWAAASPGQLQLAGSTELRLASCHQGKLR